MYNIVWWCLTNKNWIWRSPQAMFSTQYVMTRCLIDNSCCACQRDRQSGCSSYISTHLLKRRHAYHPHQKAAFPHGQQKAWLFSRVFTVFPLPSEVAQSVAWSTLSCCQNPIVSLEVFQPLGLGVCNLACAPETPLRSVPLPRAAGRWLHGITSNNIKIQGCYRCWRP